MDLPFSVLHEMHKNAFLAAQLQAKKDKEEEEKKKQEEAKRKREEEKAARAQGQPPRPQRIPKKQDTTKTASPTDPKTAEAASRLANAQLTGIEDLFEEGI